MADRRVLRPELIGITTIINNLTIDHSGIPQASSPTKITQRCAKNSTSRQRSLSAKGARVGNKSKKKVKNRVRDGINGRKNNKSNRKGTDIQEGLGEALKVASMNGKVVKNHLAGKI